MKQYYRARYYDAQSGRFLSEDKYRSSLKANGYNYVSNRPASLVDPSGNQQTDNWSAWHSQERCTIVSIFRIPWFDERIESHTTYKLKKNPAIAEEPSDDPYRIVPTPPATSLACLWEKTTIILTFGRSLKRLTLDCTYTLMCGERLHYFRTSWERERQFLKWNVETETAATGPFAVPPTEYLYDYDCEHFGHP